MNRGMLVLAGVVGALFSAAPAHAADPTAAQIVASLNGVRSDNGIPTVTEDAAMSSGCKAHDNYGIVNGGWDANPHAETPGKPGYTVEGDKAAHRSVLSRGASWNDGPQFLNAPYHLFQLLDPSLAKTGADETSSGSLRFSCVWTLSPDAADQPSLRPKPATPTVYSYPGHGRTGVPWFTRAYESPTIPAYDLGLTSSPGGPYTTGFNIFTYYQGPVDAAHPNLGTLCAATVKAPGGAVVEAPFRQGYGGNTSGGIIVPRAVLVPAARYTVTAMLSSATPCDAAHQITSTFSFTTEPRTGAERYLRLGEPYWSGSHLLAPALQDYPLADAHVTFRRRYNGGSELVSDSPSGGTNWYLETLPTGATFQISQTNDTFDFGAICWSPTTVTRTYTRTADGATAGPVSVTHPVADTCGAAPTITAQSPSSAQTGVNAVLTGTNLESATRVKFGGVYTTFVPQPDGTLRYRVPDGATSAAPVVTSATGTVTGPTLPVTFTVTGFSPSLGGPRGTLVTITGAGFTPTSTVKFGATSAASVTYVSPTTLKAVVPSTAVTGKIAVLNSSSATPATSRASFTVTPSVAPAVSSFAPTAGRTGQAVTITGTNVAGASEVRFGALPATFTIDSATQITATVPNGATTAPITVTTAAGSGTSPSSFAVTFGVRALTPSSGPVGTDVTIDGAGFAKSSIVRFGTLKSAATTWISSGRLVARVPPGASTAKVTVTTSAGTVTSAKSFSVTFTVKSFTPSSGPVGTNVTIDGAGFTGSSIVKFNGVKSTSVTWVSSSRVVARVPAGATTGRISVTTSAGTTASATDFTVT